MENDIDSVFEVISSDLPAAGIDYLMIGGHAVNHYGVVRATQDVDFMVAAADAHVLRSVMQEAGFTNIAVHDVVVFFNRPGSPLRVDFLKVDRETMDKLLANAVVADYSGGHRVRVPRLKDLLAMKLFALASGCPDREDKDFPDIVHLVIENGVDVALELKALCEDFATPAIYDKLRTRIKDLNDA